MVVNIVAAVRDFTNNQARAMPAWSWPYGAPAVNVTASPSPTAPFHRFPLNTARVIPELPPITGTKKNHKRHEPTLAPQWSRSGAEQPYWDGQNYQYVPPDHDWPYVVNDANQPGSNVQLRDHNQEQPYAAHDMNQQVPNSQEWGQYPEHEQGPHQNQASHQAWSQPQNLAENHQPAQAVQEWTPGQAHPVHQGYQLPPAEKSWNSDGQQHQPQGDAQTQPQEILEDFVLIHPKDQSKGAPYIMPIEEYEQKMASLPQGVGLNGAQHKREGSLQARPPMRPQYSNEAPYPQNTNLGNLAPAQQSPASAGAPQGGWPKGQQGEGFITRTRPATRPNITYPDLPPKPDLMIKQTPPDAVPNPHYGEHPEHQPQPQPQPQGRPVPTQKVEDDLTKYLPSKPQYRDLNVHEPPKNTPGRGYPGFEEYSAEDRHRSHIHLAEKEKSQFHKPYYQEQKEGKGLETIYGSLANSLPAPHSDHHYSAPYRCECYPVEF